MTIAIGVLGATGYTGGELIRLLATHPKARITHVTSERFAGRPLSEVHPHLRSVKTPLCQALDPEAVVDDCDLVFCALPHLASMKVVPTLLEKGRRVIDLSADFRLKDAKVFEKWYGAAHPAPELFSEAVYGLPELYREQVAGARLVANPGCYPTSVLLALTPLMGKNLIDEDWIVIDSKSGVSGAGRSPAQETLFAEVAEGFKPYKVVGHRHIPEMEQELGIAGGGKVRIRFTPHLIPQNRGILSTCLVRPTKVRKLSWWVDFYRDRYRGEEFVQVLDAGVMPATNHVRGSNRCELGLAYDDRTGWLLVLATIDNLVKGAAGQAIQNMNCMWGMEESTGLDFAPIFP
ncbi:MAG: N-acetyl-gamma-glutamyl-phosphate reductase [Magnetococcales bacterium]|nr:N-acetyl-gamma-glutamyl-phosphate reductase [Magnetococcales bacterium]